MNTISNAVSVALLSLMLCACSSKPEQHANESHEESPQTNPNIVDIPESVRTNLGITFAKVERRRVQSTIRIPGAFELEPIARLEYRMTLPGHIELAVDQYQQVQPGDLLYRFRSTQWPELQHEIILGEQEIESAQAAIEVAQSRIDEAQQRLRILHDRLESLTGAQVRNADLESQASEIEASLPRLHAELRQSQTLLGNAHRTHEHALHRATVATGIDESRLKAPIEQGGTQIPAYRAIDWIEVRAQRTGIVELLAQTDGAFADAPALVLSTVDPTMVRFRAQALQADLPRLSNAANARIVPPNAAGIDPGDAVEAQAQLGLEAHPEQRTLTLLAVPEGTRDWIRPGVSAFLEVVVDSTEGPALAIPRAAVVRDGIVYVFFRRDPKNPDQAIRIEADMGVDDGRWVAINSGLAPNDEVILSGAYELKLATQQSGAQQKGGHFHADGTFHEEHDD